LPDGGLQWTTPTGDRVTTHPPRYGTDDDLPPPPQPRPTRTKVPGHPTPPREEPAPF
ncbi:hypothetical protein SAMN06272739_3990, partial [Blastococcus haudaquaticus]